MKFIWTPLKKGSVSVTIALLIAGGMWWGLEAKQHRIEASQKMVSVLRAKKYISAGHRLSEDLVEEVLVPEAYVTPGAFSKKSELLDTHKNSRYKARIGVPKGESIVRSAFSEESSALGLGWILEPGLVAMTLRLNIEEAVAGLIRPGDRVQVILTADHRSNIVLPSVPVIAMGDQVWDPSRALEPMDVPKPMATDSILVTLMLKPSDAMAARLAASRGVVTLALVSPLGNVQ